jgi:signal transduction histidine kinase
VSDGATVVVVDDRAADRRLLRVLLEHGGYRVIEAADGVEGLRLARAEHPALVVTDIVLPGMGGYELARRLLGDPDMAGVGVVLCSAHFRPAETDGLAATLGVSAVLAKPFEPEDLYRAVDAALDPVRSRVSGQPQPTGVPGALIEALSGKLFEKLQELELLSGDRQALLGFLVRTQEEERRQVARKLHDDAIQVMFGAVFLLEGLARRQTDPELATSTRELAADLTAAGERLNRFMHNLQPPSTGGQTLVQALSRAVDRAAAEGGFTGGAEGTLDRDPTREQFTVVYRIAQEALANVVSHAKAERVEVVLTERDEGVLVRVEDDGVGCPPDLLRTGGVGLTAMRERAGLAGGWWRIESAPPRPGTLVEYWIPLET